MECALGQVKKRRACLPTKATRAAELSRRKITKLGQDHDIFPKLVDGRTILAKRYRTVAAQLIEDQGGIDNLSEIRLQLLRRFAGCACLAESIEAEIVAGSTMETERYTQLIAALVRLSARVGVDRIPRTVTPDLKSYLEQRKVIDADEFEDEASE